MSYKLLIVDGNHEMRKMFSDFFATMDDITVCGTAENGLLALKMVEMEKPDIVLMDLIMPVLDGIGFLERLNVKYGLGSELRPKVVVVSAVGHEMITKKAFDLHADYFVMKPFDFNELHDILISVCGNTGKQTTVVKRSVDASRSVTGLLSMLEINVSNFGYKYIKMSRIRMLNPESRILTAKEIYGMIGAEFSTTVECV